MMLNWVKISQYWPHKTLLVILVFNVNNCFLSHYTISKWNIWWSFHWVFIQPCVILIQQLLLNTSLNHFFEKAEILLSISYNILKGNFLTSAFLRFFAFRRARCVWFSSSYLHGPLLNPLKLNRQFFMLFYRTRS